MDLQGMHKPSSGPSPFTIIMMVIFIVPLIYKGFIWGWIYPILGWLLLGGIEVAWYNCCCYFSYSRFCWKHLVVQVEMANNEKPQKKCSRIKIVYPCRYA